MTSEYELSAIGWLENPVTQDGEGYLLIRSPAGASIQITNDERKHIVKCVNMHDELVSCPEDAKRFIPEHPADTVTGGLDKLAEIDELLAKAKQ